MSENPPEEARTARLHPRVISRLGAGRRDAAATSPETVEGGTAEREWLLTEVDRNQSPEREESKVGDRYHDATERAGGANAAEQALWRQRERLAALNRLYEIVWDVTDAVTEQSTREGIERVVCERLVATDSYQFAWIGEVDTTSQTVALRAKAGVEGYFDGIAITVDPDDGRSEGPTGRALRTGEIQTARGADTDSGYDSWHEQPEAYGIRSMAAIPIVHEGAPYGVLNVYSRRPRAFEGRERAVLGRLGGVVGHAIASLERKRALTSDELLEIEFRIPDLFTALDLPPSEGRITLTRAVPVGDDEFLTYGTASEGALDVVEALVERLPSWTELTVLDRATDDVQFRVRLTGPPALSAVVARGGYVDRVVIEDADYRMTSSLPPSVDVRRLVETVADTYPDIEMISRRQVCRSVDMPSRLQSALADDLTDRQRAALEAAYCSGFFEWPRDATAEEVAESLGISAPTFHQHRRAAERKLFRTLFSESAST